MVDLNDRLRREKTFGATPKTKFPCDGKKRHFKIKLSVLFGKMDLGVMHLLWTRDETWKMGELVVYGPGVETCETTGEL